MRGANGGWGITEEKAPAEEGAGCRGDPSRAWPCALPFLLVHALHAHLVHGLVVAHGVLGSHGLEVKVGREAREHVAHRGGHGGRLRCGLGAAPAARAPCARTHARMQQSVILSEGRTQRGQDGLE